MCERPTTPLPNAARSRRSEMRSLYRACSCLDLELIFRNLIDNAIKYSGEPPAVTINAGILGGDTVEVTIGDNGKGIPQNLRRRLFGRFARLGMESSGKNRVSGWDCTWLKHSLNVFEVKYASAIRTQGLAPSSKSNFLEKRPPIA